MISDESLMKHVEEAYRFIMDQDLRPQDKKRVFNTCKAVLISVQTELLATSVEGYKSSRNGFLCKENKNPEYNQSLVVVPFTEYHKGTQNGS